MYFAFEYFENSQFFNDSVSFLKYVGSKIELLINRSIDLRSSSEVLVDLRDGNIEVEFVMHRDYYSTKNLDAMAEQKC